MAPRSARSHLLGLAVLATGCGLFADADAALPLENLQTTGRLLPGSLAERPTGPHVELLTATIAGDEVEIAMQRDGDGVCFVVRLPPQSSQACGEEVLAEPIDGPFGLFKPLGPGVVGGEAAAHPLILAGLVAAGVDAVVAELGAGATARATLFPLAPAQVDGFGFLLALPPETPPRALVAFAADGTELGRAEYAPGR